MLSSVFLEYVHVESYEKTESSNVRSIQIYSRRRRRLYRLILNEHFERRLKLISSCLRNEERKWTLYRAECEEN